MFKRLIESQFLQAVASFPVVILTGARQTGKSTLCKAVLGDSHSYVSLEDPDIRRLALDDPRTFLEHYPAPVIIDEFQYAPELPSYIQGIVDANRSMPGQYILTGSQHFLLMEKVSQSLAGRAALLTLYPCSVTEIDGLTAAPRSTVDAVADWILRGGYPELRERPQLDRTQWCASYIQLYLERDVRNITQVGDLQEFERFIHQVALRTGQLLNYSDLARDVGVSVQTAKRWLSVLIASYQVYLLPPYHANISKRLIKAPKLYFGDTATASYLMGIHDPDVLLRGPQYGALFETAVVLEHIKEQSRSAEKVQFSFFRTKDQLEVDLLIERGTTLHAREIKAARTLTNLSANNLDAVAKLLKQPNIKKAVLAPVDRRHDYHNYTLRPWHDVSWQ